MRWCLVSFILIFSLNTFAEKIAMTNVPIAEFVDWYSRKTGKGVIIPNDFNEKITVYNADISPENLPAFFVSVMASRGYEVSHGNPVIIAKSHQGNYGISALDKVLENPLPEGSSLHYLPDYPTPQRGHFFTQKTQTYSFHHVLVKDIFSVIDIFLKSSPYSGGQVAIDEGNNRLIVTTTVENHKQIQSFVPSIDIQRTQVLIESIMFETTDGSNFDFSFGVGKKSGSTVVGGVNTATLGDILSSSGGSFGIFSGNVLGLALTAVQGDKHSKLLSVPRILTLSGKRGLISSGQNVPIVTGKIIGQGVDVKNPFQTIERRDVGISLDVTPVVLNGDSVMLTVKSKADSVSNISNATDIVFNQRSIDTTVQLKNGDTLLIGGLIQHNAVNSTSSVPFISAIPLIGWLFDARSDTKDNTVMYILIRARVLNVV
ncbi:secretin N-terminal domain-containing protein [Arsenophonus sp.]|uniref:secretin N-terminal domain-containing protein n=1 Tax=Arsenophonus sp. TaxID=1872640 RepID=UPI00387A7B4A